MQVRKVMHHIREHSTTILFLAGFCFDMLLLPEAGHMLTVYIGFGYLSLVGLSLILRELVVNRNRATKFEERVYSLLSFIIAYFSGSALSFVCVYVFRSADFAASWPLIVILVLCVLVNETVSAHNFRLMLDIGVLFIAVLFFTVFNMPLFLHVQNDFVFAVSIGFTIVASMFFVTVLRRTSETAEMEAGRGFALAVGIPMFVGMLYFLNAIPAVPLSLHTAGVFHGITKNSDGSYTGFTEEKKSQFLMRNPFSIETFYLLPQDDGVYFYGSVDAPAKITAPLSHVWEKYNESTKKWEPALTISFGIQGGRDEGYRAYSKKESITPGLWRVTIMVDGSRVVGRRTFKVQKSDYIPLTEVKL